MSTENEQQFEKVISDYEEWLANLGYYSTGTGISFTNKTKLCSSLITYELYLKLVR